MSLSTTKRPKKGTSKGKNTITDNVKDYNSDPFFVMKTQEAKTFLKSHGLPKKLAR